MSDGRLQREISASPLHYRGAGGEWQPIDTSIRAMKVDGYAFGNETNAFRTYFGTTRERLVRLVTAAGSLTVGTPGARIGKPRSPADG